jgi:hypothetical protein
VKTNYRIHTDAIKSQLKNLELSDFQKSLKYAEEADMLNLIMFGQTAKQWETKNPELKKQGLNLRDVAQIEDLIILSGLETLNAYLLNRGVGKGDRANQLVEEAKRNFISIQNQKSVKEIKKMTSSLDL